ncbi:mobilization protein [Agrobacterium rosae]|uniref:Mobilization protein n=1 Tax=Agrobacterium rosae TaxID=1972867 RepID=A0ABU4VZQ4_9HYPH|nr:mobilization protein [Agrobacterium rosae]MDX8330672.1 mobilization protein [Agrobacterium rosae]
MRKPIAQRIKELQERKRALQSRLDRQERAQETRRKILLGSFLLERLAQDGDTSEPNDLKRWLGTQLPAFLSRDADRALFADLLGGCQTVQRQEATGATGATGSKDNHEDSDLDGDPLKTVRI